jgi:hypothetical protein
VDVRVVVEVVVAVCVAVGVTVGEAVAVRVVVEVAVAVRVLVEEGVGVLVAVGVGVGVSVGGRSSQNLLLFKSIQTNGGEYWIQLAVRTVPLGEVAPIEIYPGGSVSTRFKYGQV